ncbi:MAG TPA: shikimate dehydrogenase [Dehalococcoidia bacterium]|nr:shikimate dehydrogenase [Dehalococcoidia bacterium]
MASQPALLGLIGDPVGHSISPVFQQAALDALGIPARYERWQTPAAELPARIAALRHEPYLGANVTVPHKEAVLALLDEVEHLARRAGAVNTIRREGDRLFGANTDIAGFRRALSEAGGFEAGGKRAIVLGAGGAARAVILALEQEGAAAVAVANRHAERAERLVRELRTDAAPDLVTLSWQEATGAAALRGADLLVHCTTLGMAGSAGAGVSPVAADALHERLFVCDIVANPLQTPLLLAARAAGARGLGGLPMLVYQGAAAFTLWTGAGAPVDVMLAAAERAMGEPGEAPNLA